MTALKKITTLAKKIRKLHPKIEWKDAIKKASGQLKRSGQIGKMKKKRIGSYSFREVSPIKKERKSVISVARNKSGEFKKFKKQKLSGIGKVSSLALQQLNSQVKLLRDVERKKEMAKRMYKEERNPGKKAELRNEIIAIEILKRTVKKNIVGLKKGVK